MPSLTGLIFYVAVLPIIAGFALYPVSAQLFRALYVRRSR